MSSPLFIFTLGFDVKMISSSFSYFTLSFLLTFLHCHTISTAILPDIISNCGHFCSWFLVLHCCSQKRCLIGFQSSWFYWDLFCGLTCDLSWRMFYVFNVLKKNIYSAIFRWNVLYISVRSIGLMCCSKILCPVNFLSGWSIHWCKCCVKVTYHYCIIVSFSPYVC